MALFKPSKKDDPREPLRSGKERHKMLGFLGKGRLSDVSTVFDSRLSRIVASKALRPESCSRPENIRSFINESKLIAYLDHPGVVSLYDLFLTDAGEPCYTMKLIRGNSLSWDLESKSKGRLLQIFTKLCETLAYVHDKGVAHLDLNPDNVMIGQYGEVYITDWGNARLFDPKPYEEYLKLVRGAPPPPIEEPAHPSLGTPQYMSPEQTTGARESLTPSSDIFSMGIILYVLMAGRLPFIGDSKETLFEQICTIDPPPLHEVSHDIPWRLSQICTTMLRKDPFERYHSFHEILIDFDKFLNSGEAFSTRVFNAGDTIFNEGDPGEYAFTIITGTVDVIKTVDGKEKVIATLGKDEIVGELAIFTGEQRTATIRAAEPNTIIRIMGRQNVEQELRKLSPWVEKMVSSVAQRFIELNKRVNG